MVGIPKMLATRQDWLNAFDYAQAGGNMGLKNEFRERLAALNGTRRMKVLKAGIEKTPEEQTPEDFEDVLDPASPFVRSGLTEGEVNQMIGALE